MGLEFLQDGFVYENGVIILSRDSCDKSATREEKRREERKKEPPLSPLFDLFWKNYPPRNGKQLGKTTCRRLFAKLSGSDQTAAIGAAANYAVSQRVRDGYAKDPERFLKADFWKDWLEPEVTNGRNTPHSVPYTGKGLGG